MNFSKLFKILINILFYWMILNTVFRVIGTIFPNTIPETLKPRTTHSLTYEISFIIFLLFLTFMIYQFRNFARIVRDNRLFSNEAIFKIKNLGILFIILGITLVTSRTINNLDKVDILETINVLFIPNLFVYGIPNFIIGIFFLFLSDGFKKALALKEENDLTV